MEKDPFYCFLSTAKQILIKKISVLFEKVISAFTFKKITKTTRMEKTVSTRSGVLQQTLPIHIAPSPPRNDFSRFKTMTTQVATVVQSFYTILQDVQKVPLTGPLSQGRLWSI